LRQLFHYHWWTDKVEEVETFYSNLGFKVTLRIGKVNGDIKTFNPPLTWDDFRQENIIFRIIEMRKGKTNITFGNGKKDLFDHIGLLVSQEQYKTIIQRAQQMNWKINEGERRTFIVTPWKFRIELQRHQDVVAEENDMLIKRMTISMHFHEHPKTIAEVLDIQLKINSHEKVVLTAGDWELEFLHHEKLRLHSVQFSSHQLFEIIDPFQTTLFSI
jgi:hypothetical protein